jgi:hypothetical protein
MSTSPGELERRHGTSKRPDRDAVHPRPDGVSEAEIDALGKLTAALEVVEQARGFLYGFHRLCGTADLGLGEAVSALRDAGHPELAADIDRTLVGRDIVDGRWSFQVVEAYDRDYWQVFRAVEEHARRSLGVEASHVHESQMKEREQS